MTKPRNELKNVPASVHARLLAFAKKENRDFNQVLTQYVQERLLHSRALVDSHGRDGLPRQVQHSATAWRDASSRFLRRRFRHGPVPQGGISGWLTARDTGLP